MAETAIAGDDRDREIAALRAEVAALRQEVTMLRAVKLGSDGPADWQRVVYPQTAVPWSAANVCAGAAAPPAVFNVPVQSTAAWQPTGPFAALSCAAPGMGQTFTMVAP